MTEIHFSHLIAEVFQHNQWICLHEVIGYDYRLNISNYGGQLLLFMQFQWLCQMSFLGMYDQKHFSHLIAEVSSYIILGILLQMVMSPII